MKRPILIALSLLSLQLQACKTRSDGARMAGIATDLDEQNASKNKIHLYSFEEGRFVRAYSCPLARPVVKANCQLLNKKAVLFDSFERILTDSVNAEIASSQKLIKSYDEVARRLLERAATNPADAGDLTMQAEATLAEKKKEEGRLSELNDELSSLPDTLLKLKDQDIDYEVISNNDLYQKNRASARRFWAVFRESIEFVDLDFGVRGSILNDHLTKAIAAVGQNCTGTFQCTEWLNQLRQSFDNLVAFPQIGNYPVAREPDWGKYEFGPKVAEQSKRLAKIVCKYEVTGDITTAFVALANKLKEQFLDPMQRRSPSLGGKLYGCSFVVKNH